LWSKSTSARNLPVSGNDACATIALPVSGWLVGAESGFRTRRPIDSSFMRPAVMEPLMTSMATLAVSTIFCVWRAYQQIEQRRKRQLRERVACMLWVAAMRNDCTQSNRPCDAAPR
jgi:hypothetical protein